MVILLIAVEEKRTEQIAKQQAFIALKDHKDNFANHPTCRLINPAKSELGKVSKQILDNINSKIRKMTKLNQWKKISDVINWFTNIPDMQKHSFASTSTVSTHPSQNLFSLKQFHLPRIIPQSATETST